MDLVTITNGTGTALVAGQVVHIDGSGQAVLATASASTPLSATGLVVSPSAIGDPVTMQTGSQLTLSDWTAATGSATLTPGGVYYLSGTPGRLSLGLPLGLGLLTQPVGVALTTTTTHLCLCVPTTPAPGIGVIAVADGEIMVVGGVRAGQPAALAPGGWTLADASNNLNNVVGLFVADAAYGVSGSVRTEGLMTLADWTAATGSAALTTGAIYYLDEATGLLTATAPSTGGSVIQEVGRALSATTLDLSVSSSILLS